MNTPDSPSFKIGEPVIWRHGDVDQCGVVVKLLRGGRLIVRLYPKGERTEVQRVDLRHRFCAVPWTGVFSDLP